MTRLSRHATRPILDNSEMRRYFRKVFIADKKGWLFSTYTLFVAKDRLIGLTIRTIDSIQEFHNISVFVIAIFDCEIEGLKKFVGLWF